MASGKVDEEKPAVSPAVSERAREESSDGTAAHELRDQHGEDVDKPVEDVKARVSKLVVSDTHSLSVSRSSRVKTKEGTTYTDHGRCSGSSS